LTRRHKKNSEEEFAILRIEEYMSWKKERCPCRRRKEVRRGFEEEEEVWSLSRRRKTRLFHG